MLVGSVERVTVHNKDTGFAVLKVKARGQRDLVPVVGHAASVSAGEFIRAVGAWVTNRTHGLQFKTDFLKTTPPTTAEGIEKYLGSGMVRGIGPKLAERIVAVFGAATFEIIEASPEKLRDVSGVGEFRAAKIAAGRAEQKAIRHFCGPPCPAEAHEMNGGMERKGAFCHFHEEQVRYTFRLIADGRHEDFLWDGWDEGAVPTCAIGAT